MYSTTTRYVFEQVKRSQTVRGKCSVCGGKTQQTVAVNNTVSPFNKNPDGSVRCYSEVLECVNQKVMDGVKKIGDEGLKCSKCR